MKPVASIASDSRRPRADGIGVDARPRRPFDKRAITEHVCILTHPYRSSPGADYHGASIGKAFCSHTSFDRNSSRLSCVILTACLPSLTHCSGDPSLAKELAHHRNGIHANTIGLSRSKNAGMSASDPARLKQLEAENAHAPHHRAPDGQDRAMEELMRKTR